MKPNFRQLSKGLSQCLKLTTKWSIVKNWMNGDFFGRFKTLWAGLIKKLGFKDTDVSSKITWSTSIRQMVVQTYSGTRLISITFMPFSTKRFDLEFHGVCLAPAFFSFSSYSLTQNVCKSWKEYLPSFLIGLIHHVQKITEEHLMFSLVILRPGSLNLLSWDLRVAQW